MLLDGFIVLGRILDGGANPSRADALAALSELLKAPERWAMSPSQAHEVAEQVLRFWDEYVAVFVVNAADELTTRSKVFAEIATEMWASACEQEQLTEWLSDALIYTDSDGAIALAAGLDPRIVGALLSVGANGRPEATLMVADLAVRGIATLTLRELERTLGQLATGAAASHEGWPPEKRGPRNPPTRFPTLWDETRDPGPWPFAQAACLLALPAEHRHQRANLVAEAALDDRSETVAAALCELTDATTDGCPLSEAGITAVNAALAIPVPPQAEMVRESRRRYAMVDRGHLAPGLAQVALAAADRLDELADGSGERAFEIAMHAPVGRADRIFAALKRAGIDTSGRWAHVAASMSSWISAHKSYKAALLTDLSSLADPDSSLNDGLWSFSDVGDLLAATGYQHISAKEFDRAFVHDSAEVRRSWLDAIADAHGIKKSAVAGQACYLQQMSEEENSVGTLNDDWFVASTNPLVEPPLISNLDAKITTEQQRALMSCLETDSDWIAWSAAAVLVNMKEPPWGSRNLLEKDMSAWPRHRAGLLYMVAILTAGDERRELLVQAAASHLPDYRYAARMTILAASDLDLDGSLMEMLRQDADLSVRPKDARKISPAPTHWTCNECRSINDVDVEDCPECDQGPGVDSLCPVPACWSDVVDGECGIAVEEVA
ncbi:hypothetical protein, partial [Streptosporangium canum]